jgi:hypothetical protein
VFLLGFRELASPSATGHAVQKLMDEVARDIAEIGRQFGDAAPELRGGAAALDDAAALELAGFIVSGLFLQAIEYIEHKSQRRAILARAHRYVGLLLHGALALQAIEQSSTALKKRA